MLEVKFVRFKKCVILLMSALSIVLFFGAIKVDAASTIVATRWSNFYQKSYSAEATFKDGKKVTIGYLYSQEAITDLGAEYSIKNVDYYAQGGVDGTYISVYDSKFNLIRKIPLGSFKGNQQINLRGRYIAVGQFGNSNSIQFSTFDVFADDGKISNVKDLKASLDGSKVKLSWMNPEGEENFTGVKIYQDNKNIATLDKPATSYVVDNLKLSTKYTFKVTSLDTNKIETSGITTSIETSTPMLDPPNKISLVSQDKSLIISWDDVKSPYFKGYNVYIDGKKVNSELLTKTKLNVKGLENGKSYKVQVATVNTKGVEGAKSKEVSESPSANALTVEYDVKMPFSPLDLLTSSVSLLAILGGFVLLSIAIIWFKPLKELIVKAVRREKDKK
ncbi:fibronectin type III domain-containing protein [Bacillus cereus]|uniref:fibronectin type III domain-containing protein n=1 Tax=Bacillus cereus TaxID=1396 RepID=UPI000BF9E9CA|nr:fibronectin type III domain-containing protein [Bacillus cereus]PEY76065.1 hypothetical protein CN344_21770 [Bacillus cereus]